MAESGPLKIRPGILAAAFAGAAALALLFSLSSPQKAFACTPVNQADGSKTCSSTFPQPGGCPTLNGEQVTTFHIEEIPDTAQQIKDRLVFTANCPNATLTQSFDPAATTPNPDGSTPHPPPGKQSARVVWTWTGTAASGGGTPDVTVEVNFRDATGAAHDSTQLLKAFDTFDNDFDEAIQKAHSQSDKQQIGRVSLLTREKKNIVRKYFTDPLFGVGGDEVIFGFDCIDTELRLAEDGAERERSYVGSVKRARKCNQDLEKKFNDAQGSEDLTKAFEDLEKDMNKAIRDADQDSKQERAKKARDLIAKKKRLIIHFFGDQKMQGVAASEVILRFDAIDIDLSAAEDGAISGNEKGYVAELRQARGQKKKLEGDLKAAAPA